MGFAANKQEARRLDSGDVEIEISRHDGNKFLNDDIIKLYIQNQLGYNLDSGELAKFNLAKLERCIEGMEGVKDAEVFKTVGGELRLVIEERNPLVRVIHQNGMSNYLDEEGKYMPLSATYTAHVLIATGNYNERDFRNSVSTIMKDPKLKQKMVMDDIFKLARFIKSNKFWSAQVQQIHVAEENEFELIPRIGKQRILFGDLNDMERKFEKLKIFYKEGLNNTGWNQFDTINVKYRNQIVCS